MTGQCGDKRLRICTAAKVDGFVGSSAEVSFGSPSTVARVLIAGWSTDRSRDNSCGPRTRFRYGRKVNCEMTLLLGFVSKENSAASGRIFVELKFGNFSGIFRKGKMEQK